MANVYILFGANSAIATAYINEILSKDSEANIVLVSRTTLENINATANIEQFTTDYSKLSLSQLTDSFIHKGIVPTQVIIFNGQLHFEDSMPEKKLEDLDESYFNSLLGSNTLTPILCLQAIAPLLNHKTPCTITALSARIGSISDNELGGWYSYRASKAALNMLFKTAAIELSRRAKQTRLVLFHPGTTNTKLSKPFQKNVPQGKLFSCEFVAAQLFMLLKHPDKLTDFGQPAYIDYQGKAIPW